MRREQTLEEISDGRLYDSNDMVKSRLSRLRRLL